MKYSWTGHKDRSRHKYRIERSGQARLVYVKDIDRNIPTTWSLVRGDYCTGKLGREWYIMTSKNHLLQPRIIVLTKWNTSWYNGKPIVHYGQRGPSVSKPCCIDKLEGLWHEDRRCHLSEQHYPDDCKTHGIWLVDTSTVKPLLHWWISTPMVYKEQ